MGAGKILVSGRREARLEAARACGADVIIDAAKEDAVRVISEATANMGVNTVIECAGTQETFDQSVAIVRGGGKIMMVGIYVEPLRWDPLTVIAKNLSLIGCLGGNFPASIDLLKTGKVKPLVTHVFPLEQAAEAFKAQLEDPKAIKVMIKP
jgi:threonine dehydrogenase-like Zn-dependent dehydrogenase